MGGCNFWKGKGENEKFRATRKCVFFFFCNKLRRRREKGKAAENCEELGEREAKIRAVNELVALSILSINVVPFFLKRKCAFVI